MWLPPLGRSATVIGNDPGCGHGPQGYFDAMSVAQCPAGFTVTAAGYVQGSYCRTDGTGSLALSGLTPWGSLVRAWPVDGYAYTVVAVAQCSN